VFNIFVYAGGIRGPNRAGDCADKCNKYGIATDKCNIACIAHNGGITRTYNNGGKYGVAYNGNTIA
jgi:hypothetical protein